jgi:hypothetical protein
MVRTTKRKSLRRLLGMRVYMSGAMDRVADNGVGWRDELTPLLEARGLIVFNPARKPLKQGIADESDAGNRELRRHWAESGNWDAMRAFMKKVRAVDLRMVNLADITIIRVDPDIHMCGSYEEMAVARAEKKAILVWTVGGKHRTPWWIFGMVPHQHVFGSMEELVAYLDHVNDAPRVRTFGRWFFFRRRDLYPEYLGRQMADAT